MGFHAQSSIEPARYGVWLSRANHTYRVTLLAAHVGIHLLTDARPPAGRVFGSVSGDEVDKFAGSRPARARRRPRAWLSCPHRLVARKSAVLDEGGDHVCVVTEPVEAATTGPFAPLRLSAVADLSPATAPPSLRIRHPRPDPAAPDPDGSRRRRRRQLSPVATFLAQG